MLICNYYACTALSDGTGDNTKQLKRSTSIRGPSFILFFVVLFVFQAPNRLVRKTHSNVKLSSCAANALVVAFEELAIRWKVLRQIRLGLELYVGCP